MPKPTSEYPTDLELLIRKVLWEKSPVTVREVRSALEATGRKLAHTTVITMLQTMVEKGKIEKLESLQGKAFRFVPILERDDVAKEMLGDIIQRVFDGLAAAVMLSLFDVTELDAAELTVLRKLLNQRLREAKS